MWSTYSSGFYFTKIHLLLGGKRPDALAARRKRLRQLWPFASCVVSKYAYEQRKNRKSIYLKDKIKIEARKSQNKNKKTNSKKKEFTIRKIIKIICEGLFKLLATEELWFVCGFGVS